MEIMDNVNNGYDGTRQQMKITFNSNSQTVTFFKGNNNFVFLLTKHNYRLIYIFMHKTEGIIKSTLFQ